MKAENKSGILSFLNNYKFEFLIMLFVFVYLYPVLGSGFVHDDVFNSMMHGVAVNGDMSVSSFVADNENFWLQSGRVFPLGPLIYYFFDVLSYTSNMCLYYKIYIVLLTMANVWLCGVLVEKITHSKRLKLFVMLIIPIFFQVVLISFNALYSFHGLVQNVMLFGLLSLIFAILYFEKKKKRDVVLSTVFMACAMLFYEVGFLFIFAVIFIALFRKEISFWSRVKSVIPQMSVFLLIFMVNVYARMTAEVSSYSGVDIHLGDMSAIIKTFLKQFSAAVPLTQAYFGKADIGNALIAFDWRHLVCLPIFAFMSYMIAFRLKKDDEQESNKANLLVILIGGICVAVPCFLISLSARYQGEVHLGYGHLPVYAEWLGMALITTGLFSLIANLIKKKTPVFLLCIVIGLPIMSINISTMDAFFTSLYPHSVVSRETYVSAIRDGFYDEVNDSSLLVYDNGTQFLALPTGDMFATYADRKIVTQDVNAYKQSLSVDNEPDKQNTDGQQAFSAKETDAYFTKELFYDVNGGLIVKGHLDVSPDADDPSKIKMLLSNVQLYLNFPEALRNITIEYMSFSAGGSDAHSTTIDAARLSKDGIVVDLSEGGLIDADSIIIRQ